METPNQQTVLVKDSPSGMCHLATSIGITPIKEGRDKEIANSNNQLANVFPHETMTLWTHRQLSERRTWTKKKKSIAKPDNALNVASKATLHVFVPPKGISKAHSLAPQTTAQPK